MSNIGRLIGVGPGGGIGLMLSCLGVLVLFTVGFAFLNPRLRQLETAVPDAVDPEPEPDFSALAQSDPSLRNI